MVSFFTLEMAGRKEILKKGGERERKETNESETEISPPSFTVSCAVVGSDREPISHLPRIYHQCVFLGCLI